MKRARPDTGTETTTNGAATPLTSAKRTAAVLDLYRHRSSAPTTTQKTYTVYLVVLAALIVGGPLVALAHGLAEQWVAESTITTVQTVLLSVLFAVPLLAFAAGKFVGPFATNTFVMRVLTSTDISPRAFLARIAAPRLVVVALCTAVLASGIIYALGQQIPESWSPLQLTLTSLATAASTAGSWVLGQVAEGSTRGLVGTLIFTAAIAAVLIGAAKALPLTWLLATALTGQAILSTARVRPQTLLATCGRTSTARMFVSIGAAHYALDLFGDLPRRARGSAMLPTNRLRSSVGLALVRLLRRPSDAAQLAGYTGVGALLLVWGIGDVGSISQATLSIAGALSLYVGLGSGTEFWRSLRSELASRPLYGGGRFRAVRRNISGLFLLFVGVVLVVGSSALVVMGHSGFELMKALAVVLAVAMSVGFARVRNATKGMPPARLVYPLLTPLGDASGLMLGLWQAEGVLIAMCSGAVLTVGG